MLRSWAPAPALALLLLAGAAAFTVDCDKDYADCDRELSKLTEEDELATSAPIQPITKAKPNKPEIRPAREFTPVTENSSEETEIPELLFTSDTAKPKLNSTNVPKGRLLNVSMDELQSFANALHNRTKEQPKKKEPVMTDLSDVSLDSDDDLDLMPHQFKQGEDSRILHKALQDNEHDSNEPRLGGSSESETCSEHGIGYKTGEKIDRGCDESCECTVLRSWQCTPRCQQPYIRRGRRLADPLCFETPVDNCCSIIACASNNHETVETKTTASTPSDRCRYGTTNYTNGQEWEVGCEQRCSCGANGVVTCKPRCNALSPSEHCINVQDPHDVCCQVQVCDVTHDAHEHREPLPPTPATTMQDRMDSFSNDLVASTTILPNAVPNPSTEPAISFTVLTNNSVQVNLARAIAHLEQPFHFQLSKDKGNSFKDVVLNNSKLENLEQGLEYILRMNETGKTYEFIIPLTNVDANDVQATNGVSPLNKTTGDGCISEGVFYSVGDEFRIGCSELCECVGPDEKECAALECPSHVGLEIMSPTCVRWAPDPPDWVPQPPACCPSKMRCLSDGSCDYHGNKIPNWSEVPVTLTGCELRCFCESGTLDCQNICSPLPPLPPQTLRCQPGFKPAPVNISDDDCCKQWGCIQTVGSPTHSQGTHIHTNHNHSTVIYPTFFITPLPPIVTSTPKAILPLPPAISSSTKPFVTPDETNPMHHQVLFQEIRPIYSKLKQPHTLIKTPISASGGVEVRPHPKLVHSVNYTNHKLMVPYRFPGPLANPESQAVSPLRNDFRSKYPAATKENGSTMMNRLSVDHVASSTEKLYRTEKPTRTTTVSNPTLISTSIHSISSSTDSNQSKQSLRTNAIKYFEPNSDGSSLSRVKPIQMLTFPLRDVKAEIPKDSFGLMQQSLHSPHNKQLKFPYLQGTPSAIGQKTNSMSFHPMPKIPQISKTPNPYQHVLIHHLLTPKPASPTAYKYDLNSYPMQDFRPTYSPENLDELLSQLEQAERRPPVANDRPTSDSRLPGSGSANQAPGKQLPVLPPFIPTIPPDAIHFPTEDDLGDLGQNNDIHRPQQPPKGPPKGAAPFAIPALIPPGGVDQQDNMKLNLVSLVADSPSSVKMLFELSPVLVGLRGSVDLRYTDKDDEDVSHWYSQVFAPADEVLTTARLEFRLSGLRPSTVYKLRGKLYLHNLPLEPVSAVYTVRTMDAPQVMEEKRRAVQTGVRVHQVNATAAQLSWRHFTEDELQYIDGIQVRYRPLEQPIYSMTEVLHHSRVSADLLDLRPGSRYEASLVLVPPPRSPVELFDPVTLNFTTPVFYDMYNWSVTVEAEKIGADSVEVTWHGVPAPPERYVRVYRAAHSCDGEMMHALHRENDAFKLADRDQPPTLLLNGLRPNTKCRVWLELFLTNGKVKISNVMDITTNVDDSENEIDNEVQASSVAGSRSGSGVHGDYYSALVVVGVVAALGTLTSLLLLLVVMRRHRPHSISITTVPSAPREPTLPPYDNPAYKLELQQETMDL